MDKKYYAILLLHALGDTIGFKNGEWEFNYHDADKLLELDYVNEMIYEFIDLGGVNGINLNGWKVSDDTLLHMTIGRSMLKYKGEIDEKFIKTVKQNLYNETMEMYKEYKGIDGRQKFNRYMGIATFESINKFTNKFDARFDKYNTLSGGNGAAMRNLVIGMCLYGEDKREQLIDVSIITSMLTHNNSIGFLAGFTSALFTALALENQPIEKWVFILLDYLKSKYVKKFLSVENTEQIYDYVFYKRQWQKYIDTRFKDGIPIKIRSTANPMFRIRYFHDNFHRDTKSEQIGASGYLCMIMAYDALLDCDGKWEKLIVYAILHSGDSDTIGSIAGGLYGAVYDMGDVPANMIKYIEVKNKIKQLSHKLYIKYKQ